MASIHISVFEAMSCLTKELLTQAMLTADKKTPQYRQVKQDVQDNDWAKYLEDSDYKRWLKAEQRRNPRLTADNLKRIQAWAQSIKTSLPACCFPADFEPSTGTKTYNKGRRGCWREQKHCLLTGLVVTDFDHVDDPRLVFERWRQTIDFKKEGVLAAYITPSGTGLKTVTKARKAWGSLIDNQYEVAALLGMEANVDKSTKDASRDSFVPMTADLLYMDEELFTWHDEEYDRLYREQYRSGQTGPTKLKWQQLEQGTKPTGTASAASTSQTPASSDGQAAVQMARQVMPTQYHGVAYDDIALQLMKIMGEPEQGDRHATMMKVGRMLSVICDNDPQLLTDIVSRLPFVKAIIDERGEDVARHMQYVCDHPAYRTIPKELRQALQAAGVKSTDMAPADPMGDLPLDRWADEIEQLFPYFPCLREICQNQPRRMWPFLFFAGAAFIGSLMTRCFYYFYDDPDEKKRLNYNINGIGDPTSGKRGATHLYDLLMKPVKDADLLGTEAKNSYKEQRQERTTSTKAQKGEALKSPKIAVRIHPARTSNGEFIKDMRNAVETVDGEEMNLHMITFDTELDNTVKTQKGGQWIDKMTLELKAFHNEEDGQHYANLDSVTGMFRVYWNIITTGTQQALSHKVSESTFATGLATRLAVIPVPPTNFKMMPLRKHTNKPSADDATLTRWAYLMDKRHGELPLWKLVEHCWHWTDDHMEMAGFSQDKADEMLIKRVAHYGINISAPYVDMRHWDEREKTGTYDIDDTDRRLCSLALDIQYRCQHHYFGEYARLYFDNQLKEAAQNRRRTTRLMECYQKLNKEFTTEEFTQTFGYANSNSAQKTLNRLQKDGYIEHTKRGEYRKIMMELS